LIPSALLVQPTDVAVLSVASLSDRMPRLVVVPELKGLDQEARRLRFYGIYQPMGARTPREGDLAVYVVKTDGAVRAFIGLDPRNGCDLKLETAGVALADSAIAFHDVCHGSIYNIEGRILGGPTPWNLDELVISVRDGVVYADRRNVIPGALVLR
jgi:hypothetical protein